MELTAQFEYTQEGYIKAIEYLKSIGEYEQIIRSGLSNDGYSIVHEANSIIKKNKNGTIQS